MFLIKASTPSALSSGHFFAFAVLLFSASTATAANIPLTEKLANAMYKGSNLRAHQQAPQGEVFLRGQAVIDMVPMADRTAFIRYELAKAIHRFNFTANNGSGRGRAINPRFFLDPNVLLNPTQLLSFENIPTYSDFGADLLYWLRDSLQVTEEDLLYELLNPRTNTLCSANGICFPDDSIGIFCCPF